MKIEIRSSMIRGVTLLLTALCLTVGIPDADAQTYDPDTTVYIDALWFRAHAADCPDLILKEHKQTMTLGEADQLGSHWRIGTVRTNRLLPSWLYEAAPASGDRGRCNGRSSDR